LQPSILAKRAWFLLFVVIAVSYLWGLGSFPLVGPDEPRYAEVAREMLARHDLITPTLGGLPWFEKPPLLYWLMMLSYRVLGVTEYAARLGPTICALLTAVFVYWIGNNVSLLARSEPQAVDEDSRGVENTGRWSALVWLTSAGAIATRGATTDIVLTAATTGALALFFIAETRTRTSENSGCGLLASLSGVWQRSQLTVLLAGFYLFAGVSLLAKGLVGFIIIFGVIALYYLVRRAWPMRQISLSALWGVPLALVAAATWYGPMLARHGWAFIDKFIIQHHFARFASNKFHHPAPFYFYLPVLIGLALPWTIVLTAALIRSRKWNWRGESSIDRMRVFALVWLVFPIVFFSFSGSKLIGYILPALPAAVLLIGERLACFIKQDRGEKVLRMTGVVLVALAFAGIWYSRRQFPIKLSLLVIAALPIFAAGVTAAIVPRKYVFGLIAVAMILTSAISLNMIAPIAARDESIRDLVVAADSRGYATASIVQLHTVQRGAEFYAANRISYGTDGEPVKFEGAGQVVEAAGRSGVLLCFVPIEFESQLTGDKHLQTELIANNRSIALFAVRPRP